MAQGIYKPGEQGAPAGEYIEVGPRGGSANNARQISINDGDRLPPTQESGNMWKQMK